MTPHINCNPEDFASTVIMPGDPRRSQLIAEKYLTDARLVNDVRGIKGYTGTYNGKPVSVMASGMGGPSMGIYSHELFTFMNVQKIIRVGTMGTMDPLVGLGDIVLAQSACYNSAFMDQFKLDGHFSPIADFDTLCQAYNNAAKLGINCTVGNVLTSDYFYNYSNDTAKWNTVGVKGVEMETAILYANANLLNKKALAILTISDDIGNLEVLTPEQRENSLSQAIKLALSLV